MNKKFLIKIPLKSNPEKSLDFSTNLLLTPYYISPSSLLSMFVDEKEYGDYSEKSREIIFNASIRSYEYTCGKLEAFPEEQQLILRRELALCLAINSFSKHFYRNYHSSMHRSKTFADFTVTTTVKDSPALLQDMVDSSNNCVKEAKDAIKQSAQLANSLGLSSVKGFDNITNSFSYRLWIHNNLPIKSSNIIATEKIWYNGNMYKDGGHDVPNTRIGYTQRNS